MLSARGRVRAGVLAGRGTWNCSHSAGQRDFKEKGLWSELWLQQSSSAVSAGGAMAPSTIRRGHIIQCKLKAPLWVIREEATAFPDTAREPNPLAKSCVCHRPYRDELIQKARGLGRLGPWCQCELFLQSEGVSKYYPLPSLPMSPSLRTKLTGQWQEQARSVQ